MIVPTLKAQQVGAEALAGPYQSADVSALSQGGGVASGLSSLGGDLADHAIKAKKQADQASEFEATADANDLADGLYQDLDNKDGPAAFQTWEKLPAEYDKAVSERASQITSVDARTAFEQNARTIRGNLMARGRATVEPKIFKAATDSMARLDQSFLKSVTLATANGMVRQSSTPSLPPGAVGVIEDSTGSEAPQILDERAIAPYFAAAHEAHVKMAEANADHLPTDQATFVANADRIWREDAHVNVIRGLLASGDDATARAYFKAHKADLPASGDGDVASLDAATEKAATIGTSQRAAARAWTTAEGETISARKDAAVAALPAGLSDDERSGAVKLVGQTADAARAEQEKRASDAFDAFYTARQQGASASEMQKTVEFQQLQRIDPAKASALVAWEPTATDDDAVRAEVQGMIDDADPVNVTKIDPREYVGKGLSEKTASRLAQKITEKGKLGVGSLSNDERISRAVSALYNEQTFNLANDFTSTKDKAAGEAKRQQQIGAFQRSVDDAITWAQGQQKAPVSGEQVQKIVDEMSTAILLDGKAWGTAADLSTEAGGLVPPAELVDILDTMRSLGITPSREAILELSRQHLLAPWPDDDG